MTYNARFYYHFGNIYKIVYFLTMFMDKIAKKQKKASLLKQALRTFGLMSKQSTGLFLCRSLPRKLRRSLPLVVRIHIIYTKIKTNHKSDWFLFGGRGWIRTTEAE